MPLHLVAGERQCHAGDIDNGAAANRAKTWEVA
jgi:hypothetical protein